MIGPIVQLARTSALQAGGRGFESHWVHTTHTAKYEILKLSTGNWPLFCTFVEIDKGESIGKKMIIGRILYLIKLKYVKVV